MGSEARGDTGYEHTTPSTAEAVAALEEPPGMSAGTGDAPVLPSSRDAERCIHRVSAYQCMLALLH